MARRAYRSPRREEQAVQTRTAVIDAAHRLFVANGYPATSIQNIATEARVSEQTVYRLFGDKASLVKSVVVAAVAGPEEDMVAARAELLDRIAQAASPRNRLRLVVDWIRIGYERGLADLEHVVLSAAPSDERVEALAAFMAEQRYEDARILVRAVVGDVELPAGIGIDDMTDYVYAVESSPVYHMLVNERGWTTAQYVRWFERLVTRMFLEP